MAVIARLLKTLYSIEYATGLSAIQIGIPVQVAVINLSRIPGNEIILIDPVIVSVSGRLTTRAEGCLSLPHYKGPVTRRNKITIRAFNIEGNEYTLFSAGYEAAVLQHEMDHLSGLFYWDRMAHGLRPEPIAPGDIH